MSRINTNVQSLIAQRVLTLNNRSLSTSLERLSTGLRINRGADDPAGLISSEHLDAMLAELEAETRSLSRAQNVSRVVGSAPGEVADLLIEAEALAVANANTAGLSDAEREANQMELNSILAAVDRVSHTTNFGDSHLLRGNTSISISGASVGLESTAVNDLGQAEIEGESYTLSDVGSGGAFAITGDNLEGSLELIRAARQEVIFKQGEDGAFEANAIEPRIASVGIAIESLSAANSSIRDTDYAKATAELARLDVLEGAAFRVTSAGAQLDPTALIRLLG